MTGFELAHSGREYDVKALAALNAEADALAPTLTGMTPEQAQRIVDDHPGLSIEFRDLHRGYNTMGTFGRIHAYVENGVILPQRPDLPGPATVQRAG
jgi:hypothetical protein